MTLAKGIIIGVIGTLVVVGAIIWAYTVDFFKRGD